ncbi:hypothetical protein JQ557_03105 [Bradyrhizobium sp. U87765 SZCCT0131]|uniref:hypothetical protein n=1 Tax=unclassified Bradyrhizobium TaxID=2631580 RepID=UPI001BAA221B|nr:MULTISPECIES: hypothetical protein [unclassified Bradyrhizobium]MBR1216962.1 hypothetical protein [Bradyrhizobium sp. U87765 SZCCT0131]MBR1259282.1 hypothetical protein [Bradyrhizobium sp. U87765 SZCCT0134]MBR1305423.1 hypothetical protein [Bradyrhizobium sp. U87765 SZCCT0110]MBR1321209.1 hypothetical protein [Bradyrhizobium sp. U87765 SZCCT0109]MBR1350137.1 hypothetical protein [Bradyrhizobium sp. U87765 SZCCT0048]
MRSTVRGGAAAAIGVATYLCGLAALVLVGALVLTASPPDLSSVADFINKTGSYAEGEAARASTAAHRGSDPDTTGTVAAPDTARRATTANGACAHAPDDSACAVAARAGAPAAAGGQPRLRGSLQADL